MTFLQAESLRKAKESTMVAYILIFSAYGVGQQAKLLNLLTCKLFPLICSVEFRIIQNCSYGKAAN